MIDIARRVVVKLGQMEGKEDGKGKRARGDICDILDAGIWEGLEEEEGRGVEETEGKDVRISWLQNEIVLE